MKRRNNTLPVWAAGAALILTLVAVACQPGASGDSSPLPSSATPAPADDTPLSPSTTPVTAAEGAAPAPIGTAPEASASTGQEVVLLAKEDLAQRLQIDPERIVVRSVEPVTWPDTSLGCPQPGMMYAQVLTPGFEIALEAEGQEFEYHTDSDRLVVLCADQPQSPFDLPADSRLPIFVEMVQSPLSPASPAQMPPADTSPTGVFAFDPGNRLLSVQSSFQILPTTEVLVGLTTAQTPNRPYVPSELFQIPSSQATPLSVIAIDADSGTLTLAYADQTFELRPGESRSFKQKGAGELPTIELTTLINHGRPAAIGVLSADPGSR